MTSKRAQTGGWVYDFVKGVLFNYKAAVKGGVLKSHIDEFFCSYCSSYSRDRDYIYGVDYQFGGDFTIWFYNQDLYMLFILIFGEYCYGTR